MHTPNSLKALVNLESVSATDDEHLEYAMDNNLVPTYTLFLHKTARSATWISYERVEVHLSSDGTVRHNPYTNQTDYIICKNMHKILPQKWRCYGGTGTKTDQKLFKATFTLEQWRMKQKQKPSERVYIRKLKERATRQLYASKLNGKIRQNSISNIRRKLH